LPDDPVDSNTVQKNYRFGVLNGFSYLTAETLLDPTLVIVAFLSYLTDSPLLLGLVLPIRDGAWSLPQLWVSGYLQSKAYKLSFYRQMSYLRIVTWVVIALTINFIREPHLLLPLFFLAYTVSAIASGLAGLPFLEVVSKTIPSERRGEFFAWRLGLGGLGSIGASILVRWLLDPVSPLPFPYNFGALSIGFLIAATFSVIFFIQLKEPVDAVILPRQSFKEQLRRALQIVRVNQRYRALVSLMSMLILAGSSTPFFAVYVQQELGGNSGMIGVYLAVLTTTNLLSNVYLGRMTRFWGNGRVILAATMAGGILSVLVIALLFLAEPLQISAQTASYWLIPVFILVGIRGSGMGVAGNSLILDIAPADDRSLYVGFTNTLMGLVLLLTGLSGMVVKLMGYNWLFFFALAAHLVAFQSGIKLIRSGEKASLLAANQAIQ
jgi:hypothetical protein